ncbi:MAG: tetrahydrofolate dehydrogenase/cyclohydrolase catalytic domain-containing protein [Phycisphaeraceae bacterium]
MNTTATLMDGKAVAQRILDRCAVRVKEITAKTGVTPCLATVLVGSDPASVTYTQMKRKRCEAVGMKSRKIELPETTTTEQLVATITQLGADATVHGILLQHPAPKHIHERDAFEAIPALKDVDGVTINSFGAISLGHPERGYGSCTPAGIMRLLEAYDVKPSGMHAVVIGRSPILGKPMAMMLLGADATVTICHSRTKELASLVKQADIVIAAVGRARFVKGDWIKPGAIVIDAGYNEGNVGDVDFEPAAEKASMITPVPGGVGPMTIATLIDQTAIGAARQLGVADATEE